MKNIKIKVVEAERGYILTANGCKYHLGTYLEKILQMKLL